MRQASAARPHRARPVARLRLIRSSACRATAIIGAAIDRKTERVVSSIHRQVAEDPVTSRPSWNPPKSVADTIVKARSPRRAISPNSLAIVACVSGKPNNGTGIIARDRTTPAQRHMDARSSLVGEAARHAQCQRDQSRQARSHGARRVRCLAATDGKSRSIIDEIYRDGYVPPLHHGAAIVFASILVEASFDSRPVSVNSPPAECRASALPRRANT